MKKAIYVLIAGLLMTGCTKKHPVTPAIAKAALVFPEKNAVCTQGTPVNDMQSSVLFKWTEVAGATAYTLTYTDLLSGTTTTQNVSTNEALVVLSLNTPYSWYVGAKASSENLDAKSDTWKFYNAGKATSNYAPFPAEADSPAAGSKITSGTPTFKWTGNDADGDPLTYDFYFSTDYNPTLIVSGLTTNSYNGVPVKPGLVYYWKIISRDNHGNVSDSGVFHFSVEQ